MKIERIDGLKYNLERLSEGELEGIHGYLLAQHTRLVHDIGVVEGELFARRHEELPFESGLANYERALGNAVLAGEIDCAQAMTALGRYENAVHEQAI